MEQTRELVVAGQLAVATAPGSVLTCAGLGSCVAVVLRCRAAAVAGVAHVMLPASPPGEPADPYRYADRAVPALVEVVRGHAGGAEVEALIAGGATLPGLPEADAIAARNLEAVLSQLSIAGVAVHAQATGGEGAQTISVELIDGTPVTVREPGGRTYALGS